MLNYTCRNTAFAYVFFKYKSQSILVFVLYICWNIKTRVRVYSERHRHNLAAKLHRIPSRERVRRIPSTESVACISTTITAIRTYTWFRSQWISLSKNIGQHDVGRPYRIIYCRRFIIPGRVYLHGQ